MLKQKTGFILEFLMSCGGRDSMSVHEARTVLFGALLRVKQHLGSGHVKQKNDAFGSKNCTRQSHTLVGAESEAADPGATSQHPKQRIEEIRRP